MRSSKSKAMDQVKQWCGSMKDEDNDCTGIFVTLRNIFF